MPPVPSPEAGVPQAEAVRADRNAAPALAADTAPLVVAPVAVKAESHEPPQDFVLVDTDPDVQAAFVTPASDALLEAAPRPVALRPDTPVTVLPGLASLSRNDLPRTTLPAPAVGRGTPILAWGGSIAAVVVALAAIVIFRAPVMKAWPPSARLYAALGLAER